MKFSATWRRINPDELSEINDHMAEFVALLSNTAPAAQLRDRSLVH